MKRVKKAKQKENMKNERNSDTLKQCNSKKGKMIKVQRRENMKSERNGET